MQDSVAISATKVKKEKSASFEQPSRGFAHQNLWFKQHPYSSTMSLMHMPSNSSSGMTGYPPWTYFDPWMQYNFLHHERVLPNHYMFD